MSVPSSDALAPVPIPDGLAEMAPGAQLAAILEETPVARVSGHDKG